MTAASRVQSWNTMRQRRIELLAHETFGHPGFVRQPATALIDEEVARHPAAASRDDR